MSSLWYTPTAVLWLLTWLAAPPASLGEAAMRESIRRQATTKSTASLTNLGREMEPPPAAAVSGLPTPPDPAAAAAGAEKPAEEAAAPAPQARAAVAAGAAGGAQDEKFWRTRMERARQAVDKDNVLIDALQSRINALQADVVNIDDPVQQGKARQNLGTALTELDNMKKQRDTDLKTIAAIQDEARRSNVPPGWIR